MKRMHTTICPQYARHLSVLLQHTFELTEEEFEIGFYDVPHEYGYDTFILLKYDEENPVWSVIIFKYGSVEAVLDDILERMRNPVCIF